MFPTVEPAYLRSLLSATSNSRAYSATRHLLHAADPKEGTEKPERRPAALRSRSMPRSREDDAKSVRNEAERDLSGTRSGDRQRSQERHEPREERRLRKSERREQRRARRGERVGIGAELEGKMTNFAQETLQLGISSLDGALSRLLPASISSTPTASTASFVADDSVAQNDGAESSSSSPSPSGRVPLRPQAFYLSHADLFRTPSYITSVRSYLAQKTNGKLSTSSLENIMRECNHDLALSLARADEVVRNRGLFRRWLDGWGLRSGVESAAQPADSDPEFEMELAVLEREERQVSLRADEKVARDLNEKAYEDEGQSIECGCCFGEYAWETLCACAEGHLFCINCVSRRVSEYLFGATAGGRAGGKDDAGGDWAPRCMDIDSGCTAPFPPLAIERALSSSPELRTALDRRAADAALEALVCPPSQSRGVWAMLLSRAVSRTAAGKNRAASKVRVVKCPFCEYAVVHDTDVLGDLWRARGDWAVTAPSKLVMNGQPRISSTVTAASKRSSAGRSELDSDSYSDSDRSRASSPTLSPSPKAEQSTNDDAPPNAALANASRAATAAGTAFVDFATSQWFRGTVLRPVILTLLYLVLFSLLILLDPFLPGAFGPASSASSFSSSSSPSSNDHSHHLPALIDPIGSLARVSGTLERAATELLRARGRRLGVFRCGRVQQGLGSGRALAEGAHSTDGAHAALWETVYPASDGTRSVRSDKKANEQAQSHCGRLSCLACGNEWLGPAHRCGGTGSMGGAKNDEADLGRLRRAIEIALDNAVLRTCPGCATTFIKEDGCECRPSARNAIFGCSFELIPRTIWCAMSVSR